MTQFNLHNLLWRVSLSYIILSLILLIFYNVTVGLLGGIDITCLSIIFSVFMIGSLI